MTGVYGSCTFGLCMGSCLCKLSLFVFFISGSRTETGLDDFTQKIQPGFSRWNPGEAEGNIIMYRLNSPNAELKCAYAKKS